MQFCRTTRMRTKAAHQGDLEQELYPCCSKSVPGARLSVALRVLSRAHVSTQRLKINLLLLFMENIAMIPSSYLLWIELPVRPKLVYVQLQSRYSSLNKLTLISYFNNTRRWHKNRLECRGVSSPWKCLTVGRKIVCTLNTTNDTTASFIIAL